jgi:uncharacterized repeat protein (TIGR03803 family)
LSPNGSGWTEIVLYRFCADASCTDGQMPYGGLILDNAGALYGTTEQGGANGGGTVFKLATTGTGATMTVRYNFCSQSGCADGAYPLAGLIMDGAGNL